MTAYEDWKNVNNWEIKEIFKIRHLLNKTNEINKKN